MKKYVYCFSQKYTEKCSDPVALLGSKGAGLLEMCELGLPVPPGFVISTEIWKDFESVNATALEEEINRGLSFIEEHAKRKFNSSDPLKFAVRSSGRYSMPGMMDSFLKTSITELHDRINDVFFSWNNDRAKAYREHEGIPHEVGTACVVQEMVYGDAGPRSLTGVFFTRNPITGDKEIFGEWVPCAVGDNLVGGTITPKPINAHTKEMLVSKDTTLMDIFPAVVRDLKAMAKILETKRERIENRDMQDVEFTVEEGVTYILQTRVGNRIAGAGLTIALDMVKEGLIPPEVAIARVEEKYLDTLNAPMVDPEAARREIAYAKGLPAGVGAAVGEVAFTSEEVVRMKKEGKAVILACEATTPDDVDGIKFADGVLTTTGGTTSHAMVVARKWNKCCIVGAEGVNLGDLKGKTITLDGQIGLIYTKALPLTKDSGHPRLEEYRTLTKSLSI